MPEFTHVDRNMIEAEATIWNVYTMLKEMEPCGSFTSRIETLKKQVGELGRELRDYNDQFEIDV